MKTKNSYKSPERQKFDAEVADYFLKKKDQYGLLAFIEWKRRQFKLEHELDIFDIAVEGYIRGVSKISSGEDIGNSLAWLKTTCLNVMREHYSKKRKKQQKEIDFSLVEYKLTSKEDSALLSEQDVKALLVAIKQRLSPLDFEVFVLRVLEELSWSEIESRMELQSNAALRKRYQRLKKSLQDYFFNIDNALLEDYGLSPVNRS
ncbi:MAG: sigma-70 family RNA polymerase sigma factor [Symploca sp. SIO2E9]|nr:sigma-70 family RNA polymerase sigma factor [Symploca sp. SIO2E9]